MKRKVIYFLIPLLVVLLVITLRSVDFSFSKGPTDVERQLQVEAASKSSLVQRCPIQLQAVVHRMLQFPRARQLVEKVEADSPIRIEQTREGSFEALWDTDQRVIFVNVRHGPRSEASLLRSIVFELHNAEKDVHLRRLMGMAETGALTRDAYVEAVERMEFKNTQAAAALLNAGINAGYYPRTSQMGTYRTFDQHFQMQKKMGHSAYLAKGYDLLRRNYGSSGTSTLAGWGYNGSSNSRSFVKYPSQ